MKKYLGFILDLKKKGFEIALHNVGSGSYLRNEIKKGIEEFRDKIGNYPSTHVNHSANFDNIYWGAKRFQFPFNILYDFFNNKKYYGDERDPPSFFWVYS